MTVVYYIQVAFMDATIEIVNVLKKCVQLHVLIELTPQGRNTSVVEVEHFPEREGLFKPEEVLSQASYNGLKPYFDGAASVHIVIHPHKTGLSYSTLQTSFKVWKYIRQFRPDIIHFETVSLRAIGMLFFLRSFKNVLLTIHDPVPHSGENSWKISLPRTFFFNMPVKKKFLFYSEFAKQQFEQYYKNHKSNIMVLKMSPYSYLQQLVANEGDSKKHILFFGRLSPYKGIDDLLKAMPEVFSEFPNEKLIIAGKRYYGFDIDDDLLTRYKDNITLIEKHIPNEELATLIQNAKFIVCIKTPRKAAY
jgi:glycosyltransferase involved in cell wall biosynthesis